MYHTCSTYVIHVHMWHILLCANQTIFYLLSTCQYHEIPYSLAVYLYTKSLTDSVYINVFKSVAWMLFALTNLQYLIGNSVQMTQKLFLDNQLFCLSFYYRAQTDMTFKVNTVRIKASLHISH